MAYPSDTQPTMYPVLGHRPPVCEKKWAAICHSPLDTMRIDTHDSRVFNFLLLGYAGFLTMNSFNVLGAMVI